MPASGAEGQSQQERAPYDYAVVRVVPLVDRQEFLNAGVILFARTQRFLEARIRLDTRRLQALAPRIDAGLVERHLETFRGVAAGEPAAGPVAALTQPERFHWLTSPRSTMVQTSPVHSGMCDDPEAELAALMRELVL